MTAADKPGGSWTIRRVLAWAGKDLSGHSSSSPRLDAELMLARVLACDRVKLIVDAEQPLDQQELAAYKQLHKRRRRGEPVAYLLGEREFYSRIFLVDQRVLVPRPETELLVETALRRTRERSLGARVLDLCTGSGCVAITLKKERPTNQIVATDISQEALEVARINSERLGAPVGLLRADLFDGVRSWRGKLDLITANPPYIDDEGMAELPVDIRDFEPTVALSAGSDALSVTRLIVEEARAMLRSGGLVALETVAGKAADVAALFEAAGYEAIEVDRDYGGHDRIISAATP